MGLNLAANEPALAAAEARAYLKTIGRRSVAALEIGNEPNVYGKIQVLHTLLDAPVYARPRDYGYRQFLSEFRAEAGASPRLPLSGPALAVGPTPDLGSWIQTMPDFLRREQRLPSMTVHRYPLRNCFVPPSSPQYPTVAHLLADYATRGLAASVRPWTAIAHRQHRALRVDELNSVACRGKTGVSDVFASALWVTDALFSLVRARVDGVNLHTLPHSAYQLFAFRHRAGGWDAQVQPVYYGLQLFAQAAPPGSRLLPLTGVASTPGLSVWATRTTDGTVRVVLINKSATADHAIALRPPAGLRAAATIERLTAAGVHAHRGITIGGRTYGASTTTGRLTPLQATSVIRRGRAFAISLPHASAALITIAAR
ncbi:MAG: glycosyl hydrolase family 79 C-terminal domain-containing protein, partial [Actinomycetota bacterium]|nr:glycosyl hydrolase family 79 C-terminal domain-containing protein [Actinomycetota bacterium]